MRFVGEFVYCAHCRRTVNLMVAVADTDGRYICPDTCICVAPHVCGCDSVAASAVLVASADALPDANR